MASKNSGCSVAAFIFKKYNYIVAALGYLSSLDLVYIPIHKNHVQVKSLLEQQHLHSRHYSHFY